MSLVSSSIPQQREALGNSVLAMDADGLQLRSFPHWFAVYTLSNHEKRVGVHCDQRGVESFVPIYQEVKTWKNRCRVTVGLPLFPSYLFVRIRRDERRCVLNIPGVLSILGAGTQMSPVPESYISWLRSGAEAHKIQPHPCLEVGDRVRIVWGPMSGVTGVLVRKQNELRMVLRVPVLNRSVSVEVAASDIEPADPAAFRIAEC